MRKVDRTIGILGVVAGLSSAAAFLTVGCSGDDNNLDSGLDGSKDSTGDTNPGDAAPDVITPDVVTPDSEAGSQVAAFKASLATGFCNRFQNCCSNYDAGKFDYNTCIKFATAAAWSGSNFGITQEILDRNNVTLDNTASSSCLAGLLATNLVPDDFVVGVRHRHRQLLRGGHWNARRRR